MQSRYSAFVENEIDYLLQTAAPHLMSSKKDLSKWASSVEWRKLEIIDTKAGKEEDYFGEVEFKAHHIEDGVSKILHERSTFKKTEKQWLYVSGVSFPGHSQKISRNAPCICGSGKKYKKCCG